MNLLVLTPPQSAGTAEAVSAGLPGSAVQELRPSAESDAAGPARLADGLTAAEALLDHDRPAALVLCGEGPEIAATSLVAAKLGIPQARVGAGVRGAGGNSGIAIDHAIADRLCELLLCEQERALEALEREGLGERATLVGPVGDDPEPAATAIRAWAHSYTSTA